MDKKLTILVLMLAAAVTTVSLCGILIDDMYIRETPNWRAQSIAQDIADMLFGVPMLVLSLIPIKMHKRYGYMMLGGTLLFFIYTFLLYCFDVHFNRLFILYCITLSLSFYTFLHLLTTVRKIHYWQWFDAAKPVGTFVWFFRIVAAAFYFLWLSDIIPSIISNTSPPSLTETGLPTNAVHVLDLAFFLPGLLIISHYLGKRNPAAYIAAGMFLIFSFIMAASIGLLVIYMYSTNITADVSPAYIMFILSTLSLIIFIRQTRLITDR